MEPLVSVIVPVYNSAEYVGRCVESIINQEYQNLDIIIVDDGSTDGSAAILDAYQGQDSRVRVFHRENSGVSASRNFGLDMARGEYVQFADSDDWLTPDSTKLLVRMAHKASCDMVIGDFYRVNGKRISQKGDIDAEHVMDRVEFASYMIENPADFYYGVLWNKLFCRDLIEQYHIRMDTEVNWCEDFLFNLEYIRYAESFYAVQAPVYYYMKRKGSLVSQGSSITGTIQMKLNVFDYYNAFYRDVYAENYEDVKQKVRMFLISGARDGFVMPVANTKLGKERPKAAVPAVQQATGVIADIYCFRKLMEYYLEAAARLKKLTLHECWLLLLFRDSRHFSSQQELADLAGFSPQKTGKVLQSLKSKGLLEYATNKRTGLAITLTEKSGEYISEIEHELMDLERACINGFDAEETKETRAHLRLMIENIRAQLDKVNASWVDTAETAR